MTKKTMSGPKADRLRIKGSWEKAVGAALTVRRKPKVVQKKPSKKKPA